MCGIVGIFNLEKAEEKVKIALAILKNRGKDGTNTLQINENSFMGHTLHAVVNHILQPLQGKGTLTANCEIYNWQELAEKYSITAENDAEVLLSMLDNYGIDKIEEFDGVFAFAYYKEGKIYLARDLIGVKPLWYVYNDGFAFASEKKVLEKLGFIDIQELNPRQILVYDVENKKLDVSLRDFFSYLPENNAARTEELLNKAIEKRVPKKKFGLLFSGGIDSTFLAKNFKDKGYKFTCYTAVLDTENKEPSDLTAAKKVAKELGLDLNIKKIKIEEIPDYLKKIVPLIEDSNVVKVGVALTFYIACEMAKEDGCKVIFSGLGSEEIFAGYERHKNSSNINQECVSGLLKMYERDLYRDDVLTMDLNLELRLPFLDKELISYALKIPESLKIEGGVTKKILRKIALNKGISEEFSFRKKTAAQYGSRFDFAIGKLAKREGKYKSQYLKQFYPTHNLKLGVLCSSGKDSHSAAFIIKKQNYELTCLITMKSNNPDSYMFQSAGVEMVKLQSEAMGVPLVLVDTEGEKEKELEDLEKAIKIAKERHKIEGIVSGALFSTYQRDRIEKICDKLGLKIFSPLWHKPQLQHMKDVVANGFEVILSAVAADGLDESWLGRRINNSLISELEKKNFLNIAGEGGEFESLVLDCPMFKKKIELVSFRKKMDSEFSGRLIIEEARLEEKR